VNPSKIRHIDFLHLAFDLLALTAAWYVTMEVRLLLNPYMALSISRDRMYVVAQPLSGTLLLWIAVSLWLGTYRPQPGNFTAARLMRVAESAAVVSTLAIVVTFFSRRLGADLSRSFVLLLAPIGFLHLVVSLLLATASAKAIRRRWLPKRRIAVVGSGPEARELAAAISRSADSEFAVCGFIVPDNSGAAALSPVLGTIRQLAEVINRECIDRIIVANESVTRRDFERCGTVTRRMGVTVTRAVFPIGTNVRVHHQTQFGLHLVDLEAAEFSLWQVVKRALDFLLALTIVTLLAPLFVALACLVRLTSEGPIFFRAQRVGRGGRHFTFWKFRSMYINSPSHRDLAKHNERQGHLFKIRRDPRVTPVGRIMRRLSLDELPQLFNVLAGEMSLVGPRPLPAEDLDPDGMSNVFAQWAEERARVRPGITGLWQIKGRSDVTFEEMTRLDLEYVRKCSPLFDLQILLATPMVVLTGKGAY
jgi:exopolysaccharide biosynthesis polyprenyl glycosylphosphotransferase